MESVLIDLHNHLLDSDGNFIYNKHINKYLEQRTKIECKKIIVFSDHFGNNLLENLDKYKETFKKLKCENEKQNCFLLLGTEIDIKFDENAIRHLVIIWHNDFDSFEIFKNNIDDYNLLKFDRIKDNQELFNFLNDNNNCFFLPHYYKSDKKRNFTIEELNKFNELFVNNKINCLEIQPNLITYWFVKNDEKVKGYHLLVATDRYVEKCKNKSFKQNELPIASYIYVNDDPWNDSYKIVNDFLCKKEFMSKISHNPEKDFTPPGIKYSFYLKNSMIFGNRGSGKTYLLEALKNAINYDEDKKITDDKNVTDDKNDEICSIKQFEFSKNYDNSLKQYLKKDYVAAKNQEIKNLLSCLFNDEFCSNLKNEWKINDGDYLKGTKDCLKTIKDNFNLAVNKNIEDDNRHLKTINKKYSFVNKAFPNIDTKHYEQINNAKSNFKSLITSLNEIKSDNYWKDFYKDIDVFIKSLDRSLIEKLLEAFSNEHKLKQIKETNKKIFDEANKQVDKFSEWKYTFNKFNFENYFKLMKRIEAFDEFVKQAANYIKNFENNKKIFDDCKNAKYFLFDEPEYSFDNKFIKNWSNEYIKKFKDNNNKVFVVTHNHIFWSEFYEQLNDKTYINCMYDRDKKDFLYEQFDAEKFQKEYSFKNYEVDMDSYKGRKEKYKIENE